MHPVPFNFFAFFMMRVSFVALCVLALAVVIFSSETRTTEAKTCNPMKLLPCMSALTSSSPPSTSCCSRLKEQQPCLCGYIKNPALKQYVDNPNAKRVASTCGVPYPKC
ncbi:hypothetical protein ES288_D12G061100v1 [Gossypium darwinii]|uniref:Bifunctional inhibitor/plant lipid transfer protein/seed storage helical domain-containing protein n=1 Tax=Gossypium darwinii TaxID=34276 RepID=A0A5D2A8L4_GOSDA|nr:hypothetical protein ES288_D12G061100v1 [Gossypium darwinii]